MASRRPDLLDSKPGKSHASNARHTCEPEYGSNVAAHPRQQECRGQRTRDRARCVHRLAKAESRAPLSRWNGVSDQRVARRRTKSLGGPIGEANPENLTPTGRESQQGLGQIRHSVACGSQWLAAAPAVGQDAGDQASKAGRGFSRTFDEAEGHRTRTEHAYKKLGQEPVRGLTGSVVKEGHPAKPANVGRPTERRGWCLG